MDDLRGQVGRVLTDIGGKGFTPGPEQAAIPQRVPEFHEEQAIVVRRYGRGEAILQRGAGLGVQQQGIVQGGP